MELPEIGRRCDYPGCQQLDFLPLSCKCKHIFCYKHFNDHVMVCSELKDFKVTDLKKIDGVYRCSHPGCKDTSIIPLICDKCKHHFCVVHRHVVECFKEDPSVKAAAIEKMKAPIEEFNKAKAVVDKQIEENILNVRKKKKNVEMANKIQLMRIKNKATGPKSIPIADRVYFNIQHPKTLGDKNTCVYVSKNWTIGRIIDAIADECKVKNNNNQSDALKLRLFKLLSKEIISKSVADILSDILCKGDIVDGDNLVLEYVSDDCTSI